MTQIQSSFYADSSCKNLKQPTNNRITLRNKVHNSSLSSFRSHSETILCNSLSRKSFPSHQLQVYFPPTFLFPGYVLQEITENFPCAGHEDVWRIGSLDLIILNIRFGRRKAVSFITRPLRPQGNFLRHSLMTSLGGLHNPSGHFAEATNLLTLLEWKHDPSIVHPVTQLLQRPLHAGIWGYPTKMTKNAIPSPPHDMYHPSTKESRPC